MIFLDGFIFPVSHAWNQALSPGILAGIGVFETMRSYDGKIFALKLHLERLYSGLKTLNIKSPCVEKEMIGHLQKSLKANKLDNARIRLMVWKGRNQTRISIATFSYRPFPKVKYRQGFKAIFSDILRDENAVLSRIKSVNYLPLLIAQRKAKAKGNDEAILLNGKGMVVEGSKTNIFFVKENKLYTPDLKCGCLGGITRQIVLKLARQMNISCRQVMAFPEQLLNCDEAFLTNSLIGIMPLTTVQGHIIGPGKIGRVTEELIRKYQLLVRTNLA